MKPRGFTLLEVMVAVAILGLSLTVILSAQAGLYSGGAYAQHTSVAIGLARCRMSEVELELLQKGYPLVDSEGEGPCCMDQPSDGYTCTWKVVRVILPEMGMGDGGVDAGLDLGGGLDFSSPAAGGPLGMLMQLGSGQGAGLGEKPDMSTLATQLTGSMGGVDGIATMAMTMVYPTLKPMLEASIRKAMVSVHWHEGIKERTLDVTQYLTNPQQGQFDADGGVMGLANSLMQGAMGAGTDPATGAPATGGTPLGGSTTGSTPLGVAR